MSEITICALIAFASFLACVGIYKVYRTGLNHGMKLAFGKKGWPPIPAAIPSHPQPPPDGSFETAGNRFWCGCGKPAVKTISQAFSEGEYSGCKYTYCCADHPEGYSEGRFFGNLRPSGAFTDKEQEGQS